MGDGGCVLPGRRVQLEQGRFGEMEQCTDRPRVGRTHLDAEEEELVVAGKR